MALKKRYLCSILIALLCTVTSLTGQEDLEARILGERIRITAPNVLYKKLVGTLVILTSDSLIISDKNREKQAVALNSIHVLEISKGQEHAGGAILGGMLGGVAWITYVAVRNSHTKSSTGRLGYIWTPIGMLAGGYIGSRLIVEESWMKIPVPNQETSL